VSYELITPNVGEAEVSDLVRSPHTHLHATGSAGETYSPVPWRLLAGETLAAVRTAFASVDRAPAEALLDQNIRTWCFGDALLPAR